MNKRTEIIPAILPMDYAELEEKVELIKGLARCVQIDVCDGQFVPNATWPYRKRDDSFEKMMREEAGLPYWQELDYEFDLMVNDPQEAVEEWITVGASRLIVHSESKGDIGRALEAASGRVQVGLAMNIETPCGILEQYKGRFGFVQLMGIDRIGFQGQSFDDRVLEKIKEVKSAYPDLPVSIDGGVGSETAASLIEAGADRLVIGSAIFNADNPIEALSGFKRLS